MKETGKVPEDHTYTSLFNACALSPFEEDGLQRARKLRQTIFEKQITLNQKTFHAMMKGKASFIKVKALLSGMCGTIVVWVI